MHIISNKSGFLYLLKIPIDPLLHIYLFECESLPDIVTLLESIQNYVQMSFESVGIKIPKAIISKSSDGNDDQCLNQILGRNGTQATPASNLKLSLSIKQRNGNQHDRPRISTSKSYTSGFNSSYKEVNSNVLSNVNGVLNVFFTDQYPQQLTNINEFNATYDHPCQFRYITAKSSSIL